MVARPTAPVRAYVQAEDLLILEGEAHRVGRGRGPEHHFQRLRAWAAEHFPITGVAFETSREILEAAGGSGFAGANPWDPDQVLIASGSRLGGAGMALYRDPQGHLRELAATCPILGQPVRWLASDRSWSCPCHGHTGIVH